MASNEVNTIKIQKLLPFLKGKERISRLYLASEAESLGRGGITAVSKAAGVSREMISEGIKELNGATENALDPASSRERRSGAGRPGIKESQPGVDDALLALVDKSSYGNPENPLRWTTKSLRNLAEELMNEGFKVSYRVVGEILKGLGFSLQQNKKMEQVGIPHVDKGKQFDHINERTKYHMESGNPAISIDCKKKELVGNYKNAGVEWCEKGQPILTKDHEFLWGGKAAPYGIYDMLENEGYVKVGVSSDTAEFAVATIEAWWRDIGMSKYPNATRLYITADGGGSNGSRNRLWKKKLQDFANSSGLEVEVSHFSPGASKWNRIEHCLFSQITHNWRGRPLESLSVIINLIGATKTKTGLKVTCSLDDREYHTGIKVSDEEINAINIERLDFHGEWNYIIRPQNERII